jgi:N-ethylmaleimide reductase
MSDHLFSNYTLGKMQLRNRVVMAPMTRNRCPNNLPNDLVATYYAQRSEAGLIITEGTSPSDNGLGYARIPGLYTNEHVHAWQKVTDAVHHAGSRIFVQLMHCGRVAHAANMPTGLEIVAPSALPLQGEIYTDDAGLQAYPVPEEMTESDILSTIEEYAHSASLAMTAGFDGVELHAANGYLIDQFLNTASNQRHDRWGGSIENRIRFAVEVAKAVVNKIGAEHVGMRISPYGVFNGMTIDNHTDDLFERLAVEMQKIGLLYLHIVDHSSMGAPEVKPSVKQKIRASFKGTLILSGGYDVKRADADLAAKKADLFAFGRGFISNPKLVSKLKKKHPLLPADMNTFYTPGEKGYTDYPLEE